MPNITTEEWLKRCSAQFIESAKLDQETADEQAEMCLENLDLDDSPEDAAIEEMSYWDDDERSE